MAKKMKNLGKTAVGAKKNKNKKDTEGSMKDMMIDKKMLMKKGWKK